jgi:hypothetical protein
MGNKEDESLISINREERAGKGVITVYKPMVTKVMTASVYGVGCFQVITLV